MALKLVFVRWHDSFERRGWLTANEWKVEEPLRCSTVGWVIGESDDCLEVAQTYSEENETNHLQVHHVLSIPKVAITSMHEIPPTVE